MDYRELGRTGVKVSRLCLGTMTFGEQNSEAEGHAQMDYAFDRGINIFDAAEIYPMPPKPETQGRTEAIIGTWLAARRPRDKVMIATKVAGRGKMTWLRKDGSATRQSPAPDHGGGRGEPQAPQDGLHRPLPAPLARPADAHLRGPRLSASRRRQPSHPRNSRRVWESSWPSGKVQVRRPVQRDALGDDELSQGLGAAWASAAGLDSERLSISSTAPSRSGSRKSPTASRSSLLAYSPLGQGYLSGKYEGGALPPGSRKTLFDRLGRYEKGNGPRAISAYMALARRHGLDPAQMAIAFAVSRPFVTSTIIGATTMDQLKTDIAAAELKLSAAVLADIEQDPS